MAVTLVLAVSVLLQFSAAILALRLIRVTGRRTAWALIAAAVFLMAVRRFITLFRLLSGDLTQPPDLTAELVALVISVLMVAGVARIAPLFHAVRQSEEALRGSQERLRLMMEQMGAILWTTDNDLRFTSSQGAKLEALNLHPDQIVGRTLCEYFQTDDPEFLPIAAHHRALRGEPVTYEQTWAGNTYQSHLEPLRDVAGDIVGVIGVSLDITERKRAELELLEAERRFRTLLDNVKLVAVGLDQDGNVAYANLHFLALTGYTLDKVLGKEWFQTFIPERERPVVGAVFSEIMETGIHPHYENHLLTQEGEERLIAWNNTLLLDLDGKPVGTMSIGEDITERKRAAEELRQRAQELAALNAIGRQVGASLSPDQVAQAALEAIAVPVAPDLALFFLREGDVLSVKAIGPQGAKYHHAETPEHRVGECLCGLAVRQGEPLYSSDIRCDPRCTWEECKKAGLRSFAALPLHGANEIIGVLGLASAAERDFGRQAEFLETLAGQVAIALQNALLHQEIQRHAAELEGRVAERTAELKQMVNLMAGREVRMAELKEVIQKLHAQLEAAGLEPAAADPLAPWMEEES